jgi:hypothetical protein
MFSKNIKKLSTLGLSLLYWRGNGSEESLTNKVSPTSSSSFLSSSLNVVVVSHDKAHTHTASRPT